MTLAITITEDVRVLDALVGCVKHLLYRVAAWLGIVLDEARPDGEQTPQEENNAPPSLGIAVGEEANTTEALG